MATNNKASYYYLLASFFLSILLFKNSAIGVRCLSWLRRQFLSACGLLSHDQTNLDMQWRIPSFTYHWKDEEVGGDIGEEARLECIICLSALEEGEEVRQLPLCCHTFHVACIDMWISSHNTCPLCRMTVLQ